MLELFSQTLKKRSKYCYANKHVLGTTVNEDVIRMSEELHFKMYVTSNCKCAANVDPHVCTVNIIRLRLYDRTHFTGYAINMNFTVVM